MTNRLSMENVRRGTMQLAMFAIVVVVLASVPLVCSLGLDDSQFWEGVEDSSNQIEETQSENAPKGLEMHLMSFHHQESPYATPNLSLKDRASIAVKSSQERAQYFNEQITRKEKKYSSKAVFSSPEYSNQGSYLMQIRLGTPPRTFVAIADTGSDLAWVQCDPCTSCFLQPDAYFDPSQSSSYSAASCSSTLCTALPSSSCGTGSACDYKYAYGDQSTTQGVFSLETITLTSTSGGTQSFGSFGFGCGTQNQGTFSLTDGLVGLGQGPVSLVRQLGSQFGNLFSYCLVSFYSSTSTTSSLLLGSSGGSVSYTPLLTNSFNPSFYYVNLQGILVNGNSLNIPGGTFSIDGAGNGGFIIDSGTTITQLQMEAYTPLLESLESLITYPRVDGSSIGFDLCYDLSTTTNPSVPAVTFQFQNANVELPGNNLFLQVDNEGDFCLAIQGSSFGFGIYGNVQQQNFNIAFDRSNQRVGFAPKTC